MAQVCSQARFFYFFPPNRFFRDHPYFYFSPHEATACSFGSFVCNNGEKLFFWAYFLIVVKISQGRNSNVSLNPPVTFILSRTRRSFYFIFFLASLCGLWDIYSLTKDGTPAQQWKHQVLTTGLPEDSQGGVLISHSYSGFILSVSSILSISLLFLPS